MLASTTETGNIFTQAIDASYYLSQQELNKSVDYYSYEGCNMKDFDNILDKSKLEENEEELEDNSTFGLYSDEDIHRKSSECFSLKFTLLLASDWKDNLTQLKNSNLSINQGNYVSSRKLTYEFIPTFKLEA
jgi:hypothetical protein